MDEVKTDGHRSLGGGVIGFGLLAWQPGNAVAFFLQLGEQHLLVAQGIGEQLLIQLTAAGLLSSNSLRASSSSNHAPITGLMLNSDSWLGVIRRVDMEGSDIADQALISPLAINFWRSCSAISGLASAHATRLRCSR